MKKFIIPLLYALLPISAIAQTAVTVKVKTSVNSEVKKEVITPLGTFNRVDNETTMQQELVYTSGTFTTADGGTAEFLIAEEEESKTLSPVENTFTPIYPNPFHTSTTVFIESNDNVQTFRFIIYDLIGREISKTTLHHPQTEFFRGSLSDGMYFYKITDNEGMITDMGKIIIN